MNNNINLLALLGQKAADNFNKTTEGNDTLQPKFELDKKVEETTSSTTSEETSNEITETSSERNDNESNNASNSSDLFNQLITQSKNANSSNKSRSSKASEVNKKNKEKEVVIYKHKAQNPTPIYFQDEVVGYLPPEADIPDANIYKYIRENCINHLPQANMPEFKLIPGNKCEAYYLVPNENYDDVSNPKKIHKNG